MNFHSSGFILTVNKVSNFIVFVCVHMKGVLHFTNYVCVHAEGLFNFVFLGQLRLLSGFGRGDFNHFCFSFPKGSFLI